MGHTTSMHLLFNNLSFAIDEEEAELEQDAVCVHLSLESVGVIEVLQQLFCLTAGHCCDLVTVLHLFGRSDSGII